MFRKVIPFALMAIFSAYSGAQASELDRDNSNQQIQGTVVFRVDNRDGSVAKLETSEVIASTAEAQELSAGQFAPVANEKVRTELDNEAGASSWYFYYNYYYSYAYYNCYGRSYAPWYNYSYGYYSYYYYNAYSRWW
jgi:hypothetical protein